jgi:hypothetical protein
VIPAIGASIFAGSRRSHEGKRSKELNMIEKIQEPIEVLTKFLEGKIQPLRFRWRGRVFTISEITGNWVKRVGEHRVHYFSVGVGTKDYYEICYESRTLQWTLQNIYLEG